MALIKCEDCLKEISDKAPACIFCGCPVNIKKQIIENKIDITDIIFDDMLINLTIDGTLFECLNSFSKDGIIYGMYTNDKFNEDYSDISVLYYSYKYSDSINNGNFTINSVDENIQNILMEDYQKSNPNALKNKYIENKKIYDNAMTFRNFIKDQINEFAKIPNFQKSVNSFKEVSDLICETVDKYFDELEANENKILKSWNITIENEKSIAYDQIISVKNNYKAYTRTKSKEMYYNLVIGGDFLGQELFVSETIEDGKYLYLEDYPQYALLSKNVTSYEIYNVDNQKDVGGAISGGVVGGLLLGPIGGLLLGSAVSSMKKTKFLINWINGKKSVIEVYGERNYDLIVTKLNMKV